MYKILAKTITRLIPTKREVFSISTFLPKISSNIIRWYLPLDTPRGRFEGPVHLTVRGYKRVCRERREVCTKFRERLSW